MRRGLILGLVMLGLTGCSTTSSSTSKANGAQHNEGFTSHTNTTPNPTPSLSPAVENLTLSGRTTGTITSGQPGEGYSCGPDEAAGFNLGPLSGTVNGSKWKIQIIWVGTYTGPKTYPSGEINATVIIGSYGYIATGGTITVDAGEKSGSLSLDLFNEKDNGKSLQHIKGTWNCA